ncbi:MAG: glycerol-3-phosphate dehydrogenase [Magnetococcales bacterium]|nr:glycerol-3-phosphate dehydrogenase [Magnetococcales bacterium]PPR09579.1 MAG: Aerobic glycerol-3-phosphate dehydrogenase [Pseudomonadota bacterium]
MTTKTIKPYDLAIIGGGINGMAIARDAAGRGIKTFLCEKDDFGSATSAWSSKMIHGGLRYLEFYEFSLVRKALKERDILMKLAPHMVHEQRFILPHLEHLRPKWLIKMGLFLYDNLYKSQFMKKSSAVELKNLSIKPSFKDGFEYSDAVVDDHRLVIELAHEAKRKGAELHNYTACEKVELKEGLWHITLRTADGKTKLICAKDIVNATGPWAEKFMKEHMHLNTNKSLRLVKGSHIVIPKLYGENKAYTFQDENGRVVFTFPYLNDYTLIGTTEEEHKGDPNDATISTEETIYLKSIISEYFGKNLTNDDIVWHYSGVRPLIEETGKDNRQTTRDYSIEHLQYGNNTLINIWGGKLTTHRVLAEDVLKSLDYHKTWTATEPFANAVNFKHFAHGLINEYPFLDETTAKRLVKSYGKRSLDILKDCKKDKDLGKHYGNGLYEIEVKYLINHEWVKKPESVLLFRTKCGIGMTSSQIEEFQTAFEALINPQKEKPSAENSA